MNRHIIISDEQLSIILEAFRSYENFPAIVEADEEEKALVKCIEMTLADETSGPDMIHSFVI